MKQLTFEDYLAFFDTFDDSHLNMDQLNKMLKVNGFCQRRVKRDVMDDLNALQMLDPRRTALGSGAAVYPCAPLTVEEVKADIRSIGWEDCPIGSLTAVGSAVERSRPRSAILGRPVSACPSAAAAAAEDAPKMRKKKRGMRRKRRVKMIAITSLVFG